MLRLYTFSFQHWFGFSTTGQIVFLVYSFGAIPQLQKDLHEETSPP